MWLTSDLPVLCTLPAGRKPQIQEPGAILYFNSYPSDWGGGILCWGHMYRDMGEIVGCAEDRAHAITKAVDEHHTMGAR